MWLFSIMTWILKLVVMLLGVRFFTSGYFLPNNALVKGLRRLSNPLVLPFNRVPSKRFEMGALVSGVVLCVLYSTAITLLSFSSKALWAGLVIGVGNFLLFWSDLVFYGIMITVVASWLQTPAQQPVLQIAYSCTEWLTAPIRRVLPKPTLPFLRELGQLDFSPMVALLGLLVLQLSVHSVVIAVIH